MSNDAREELLINSFKIIDAAEIEYNFKYAGSYYRSNPQYFRLGIHTKIGNRITLFQSVSVFNQTITIPGNGMGEKISEKQPEYYALVNWNLSDHLLIKTGYHFINTISGGYSTKGNLMIFAITPDFGRLSFEAYGSLLNKNREFLYQAGGQAKYVFPGKLNFYLAGTPSGLFEKGSKHFVYGQKAGLKVLKRGWIEFNSTIGRMEGYNDYTGLYVYNSYDPMIFKSGVTLTYYLGTGMVLWANYSLERKEYYGNSLNQYNQFSYLGGIKWKL